MYCNEKSVFSGTSVPRGNPIANVAVLPYQKSELLWNLCSCMHLCASGSAHVGTAFLSHIKAFLGFRISWKRDFLLHRFEMLLDKLLFKKIGNKSMISSYLTCGSTNMCEEESDKNNEIKSFLNIISIFIFFIINSSLLENKWLKRTILVKQFISIRLKSFWKYFLQNPLMCTHVLIYLIILKLHQLLFLKGEHAVSFKNNAHFILWFYPKIHSNWQGSNDFVHFFNLSWGWEKMNIIDTDFFFLKPIQCIWIGKC